MVRKELTWTAKKMKGEPKNLSELRYWHKSKGGESLYYRRGKGHYFYGKKGDTWYRYYKD